ncbi:MAG: hypothetical protein M3065_04530 [Actinomycetota bacterium]|nr:hypothetical protein [Actinomycetota bacterium]
MLTSRNQLLPRLCRLPEQLAGMHHIAGSDVDHIFAAGRAAVGDARTLAHGPLSDHARVAVTVAPRRLVTPRR